MLDLNLIETIVVIMMENRSFDNMLGHLSCPWYDNRNEVDGLTPPLKREEYENLFEGETYYPHAMKDRMLPSDLPHNRDDVTTQIAKSDVTGKFGMNGFVEAYYTLTQTNRKQKTEPMGYFPPDQVPITNFLANNYAVCDRWFSPLPTSTVPNRLISLSGDSRVDETGLFPPEGDIILDWLERHDIRWRVYHAGISFFTLLGRYASVLGPNFKSVKHLARDLKEEADNEFPQVILIEPSYYDAPHFGTDQPNDNHAPLAVGFGEEFLRQVYRALTINPERWQKTVTILTYDEHGGFFDHVPPLPIGYSPPPGYKYSPFTSTGVRVPSIVISPFTSSKSVFKGNMDHTSILQFIAERFAPTESGYNESVNERKNQGIESVSKVVDLDTPRTDIPIVPSMIIDRPARLGLDNPQIEKGLMQQAFEEASLKMIEENPDLTREQFPELVHWSLTRR